ncbi:hypothetical protein Zmor_018256 [Zophobas morio]|uniref:Uncharacterized protein n=1 Tax=Zophobas morio TaxID=2755281 RepID=A0AA38IA48_9CUCU|nr:hypothetical protein Zmor_018256 [Zophobas morio]
MDLTRLHFSHYLDCSQRWFAFKLPSGPSRKVAATAYRVVLEHPSFSEHRLAVVTGDESPIFVTYSRKPIGVVPGRYCPLLSSDRPNQKLQRCLCCTS